MFETPGQALQMQLDFTPATTFDSANLTKRLGKAGPSLPLMPRTQEQIQIKVFKYIDKKSA